MKHQRTRLGGLLLAVTAALAMLALPGLASSHKQDHDPPGDAGVIQSYDSSTGVLTIDLGEGDAISALVTERTHVVCGKPPRRHHRGRGHGPGGDSDDGSLQRPGRGDEMPPPPGESGGPGSREEGEDPPGHDGTAPGSSEDPGKGAKRSARCDTDDLVAGTVVKKAEIVLTDGNAFYKVVGLPRKDEAEEPSDS
jgi:hypothetical protein